MKTLIILLLLSFFITSLQARTWTSIKNTTVEATFKKLEGVNVTLVTATGKEITLPMNSLVKADQEFIAEFQREKLGSEIPGVDAKPGEISPVISCEGSQWSYHVYLPKGFHLARQWPVCFIMSAGGGKEGRPIKRYIPAAERFGCILICSVESKNRFMESQAAVDAMAKDVYARFPVAQKLAFSTGMSGGSRMAYLLSEMNDNVMGVLACGSGSSVYPDSGDFRESKLRKGTYVYSLIGTNCFNRTGAYKSHQGFSDHCRLRFFPGGHAWADEKLIVQGTARVLGQLILENQELSQYQEGYLADLQELALGLKTKSPWEAHYLASFGAKFKDSSIGSELGALATSLAGDEQVKTAQAAEQDIQDLCGQFYEKHDYFNGDNKEIPKRSELGRTMAARYAGTSYENILTLLGEKSSEPKGK